MSKYLEEIKKLKCHSTKYLRIYCQLIEHRLNEKPPKDQYTEEHHILPRSLCTDDTQKTDKENLVHLTAREHYIAHTLLCKITKCLEMYDAYFFMSPNKNHKKRYKARSAYTYQAMKIERSKLKSESMKGEKHFNYGQNHSLETKAKIRNSLIGKPISIEHSKAIRRGLKLRYKKDPTLRGPNAGKKNSIEANLKNSEQNKKVIKTEEWNSKNSEQNKNRIHIANTITKERKRPRREEALRLVANSGGEWIILATMKPIPDYSSIEFIISSISESVAIGDDNI